MDVPKLAAANLVARCCLP